MNRFTKQDIDSYLNLISYWLKIEKKYGYMIVAGGSAMTMMYNICNTSHDIDALYKPKNTFYKIIKNIADEYDLEKDWLNDGIKGFLSSQMTSSLYKEYPNLSVRVLDADCMLALKLTSARTFTKDRSDSIILMQHLGIKNEEQLFDLIEKYIPKADQVARANYFTQIAFSEYKNKSRKPLGEQVIKSLENRTKTTNREQTENLDKNKSDIRF